MGRREASVSGWVRWWRAVREETSAEWEVEKEEWVRSSG